MIDFMSETQLFSFVVDGMAEGLLILDSDLRIRFINPTAIEMLSGFSVSESPVGMYYYDYIGEDPSNERYAGIFLKGAVERNTHHNGIIRQLPGGKYISINVTPIPISKTTRGVMLTAQDVTSIMIAETELDMAFGLTLPNSKVEFKLKQSPEYQDEFDPTTGLITITGIVEDGGYRHVVNSLKIFASLKAQGVANIIGIEKDLLVQAIIFHDLGKSQPNLHIGERVNPKEVFEDGKLHAQRGAEIAKVFYGQPDQVVEIIRYHHHSEKELPAEFPWSWFPMFRLFQLIDGLSAAMTRGSVQVECAVKDCQIYVTEHNRRPQYNGRWVIDLYTGEKKRIG